MEKGGDDEAYYRQRTVARLIDKRRQMEDEEQKEAEAKKQEELKFRVQWKEGFKKKRAEMISNKIDKIIMQKTLRRNPEMLVTLMNMEKYGVAECKEEDSLADLVEEYDEGELGAVGSPGLQSAPSFHPGNILTAPRSVQALKFLQNAVTFHLSVNKRLKEQQLNNQGQSLLRSPMASHGDSSRRSTLQTDDIQSVPNSSNTNLKPDGRVFSSYRNESKVNSLVLQLLDDAPAHNPQLNSKDTRPRGSSTAAENSLFQQLVSRRIKTVGLMSQVIRYSNLAPPGMGVVPLERTNSFSIHRSSNLTPASRMLASGSRSTSNYNNNKDNSSTTGATASVNSHSHSNNSDDASRAAQTAALDTALVGTDAMFCSLVDSIFLIGPSAQSVLDQIAAHTVVQQQEPMEKDKEGAQMKRAASQAPLKDGISPKASAQNGTTTSTTVPDFNAVLPSTMLFVTENHCPPEMAMLLPAYCYPSGVELGVRSTKSPPISGNSNGKRRKMSLNLLTQKIITESTTPVAAESKSGKKKSTIFFPSDFAISGTNNGTNNATGTTSNAGSKETTATAEPTVPPVNVHMPNRNQFILLLGDHTYQQYGVCVQLPRQFTTESGLVIHTSYVLCMMTKFPLFNYLYHLLDLYDVIFDGLKFKNLIPTQDVNYPFVAELKPLSDLAAKLKRLLVPKYPYIMNMNAPVPSGRSRARTSTDVSVLSPTHAEKKNDGPEPDYLAMDTTTESDIKAILPDIEFGYGSGLHTGGKKLTALFKRSAYQAYFSTAGAKYDPFNKTVSELIGRYDKMVQDFVPNVMHKAEKEFEDSFLVMLWALPVLLKYLPLDQIILALGCAITEMKIIVMHPDHHVISSVILALMQLLRPLRWCPPVIVILPDQYQEIIESPTPVMIGMPRLPEHFTLIEGYVVIDPQERIVHLNPIDVVESHTILLPHGSKLVNALSASAETILKCTKKKRTTRMRKSTPGPGAEGLTGESLADQLLQNTSANAASQAPLPVPLPVELDLNSYENLQLLAAVKTFMGIVSNHIQAILNTAIQMQQQSKKASQDQRRLLIKSGSLPRHALSNKKKPAAPTAAPAVTNASASSNIASNAATANTSTNTASNNNMSFNTTTTATAANSTSISDIPRIDSSMYISAPGSAETSSNSIPRPPSLTQQVSPTTAPMSRANSGSENNVSIKSMSELNLSVPSDKSNFSPAGVSSTGTRRDSTLSPRGLSSVKSRASLKPTQKPPASGKRSDRRQSELGPRTVEEPEPAARPFTTAATHPSSKFLRKAGSRHSLPMLGPKKDSEEKDEHTPLVSPRITSQKTPKGRTSLSKEPSFNLGGTNNSANAATGRKLTQKTSDMSLGIAGKTSTKKPVEDGKVKAPLSAKGAPLDTHGSFHRAQTVPQSDLTPIQSSADLKVESGLSTKGSDKADETCPLSLDVPDSTDVLTPPTTTHIHRHNSSNALVFTLDSLMSPMVYPAQKKSSFLADKTEITSTLPPTVPTVDSATVTVIPASTLSDRGSLPIAASPTFDNLPSKADLFADDEPRDSLNDETCSEITVTDAGGHHGRGEEESSLMGRVQETSSNDSGDKLSDINESVCSDASSLPSLKSNAPLLLVREIGQSGAKFIDKIQETQMYSNYCCYVKAQSAQAAAKLIADAAAALTAGPGVELTGRGRAHSRALAALLQSASFDFDASRASSPRSSRKHPARSQLHVNAEDLEYTGNSSEEEEEELALDSLQEVFSILLTGTVEMNETLLDTLYAKYDDLYAETSVVDVQALRVKYVEEFTKAEKIKNFDAVFHGAIQKFHAISAAPLAKLSVDSTSKDEPLYESSRDPDCVDPSVNWCNGLVCRGLCNTAYCSEICLSLWEHKVKRIRRQAVFKNILIKRHNPSSASNAVASSSALRPAVFSPDQKPSRLSLSLAVAPKVEVVKHHRETQSQFEQRKAIAENRKLEGLRSLYPEISKLSQMKETQKSVYGPAHGGQKRLLYARGSTSDPATLAIAKHYAMKQRKVKNTQVRKAMRVIKPLMLRFVCLYRRYKFFHAIYTIQALIRGFYVRNHIPELVEALIARRIRRFLACLRIRRFLRQNADQIYRRHVRIKMEEQRRRRATLSIPVKSANEANRPNSPKGGSHQAQRTPRRIYSLSDDILPTSGIKIAGLGGSPQPSAPASSSSATGDSAKHLPEDLVQLTSEKGVLDIAAGDGNEGEKVPANSTNADNSSNSAMAGGGTGSAKEGASPRAPRYSTGTYTDRVKEYLQFGKVTHRNSVAAMPQTNKYAAHYMQKRNSKNAKDLVGLLGNSPPAVGSRKELPVAGSPPEAETLAPVTPAPAPEEKQAQGTLAPEQDDLRPELSNSLELNSSSDEKPILASAGAHETADESEQVKKLRRSLYISTRFASEDSKDSNEAKSTVSGGSLLGSPSSAFNLLQKEGSTEEGVHEAAAAEDEDAPLPHDGSNVSPSSGIRTYHNVEYTSDSDEDITGNSLRFSDIRSSDILIPKGAGGSGPNSNENSAENLLSNSSPTASSQHSLLAMNLVEGSMKYPDSPSAKFSSIEEFHQYNKSTHSIIAHAPSEDHEDDRASVLSSNSNSTTPQRRLSSTASADAESTQPVLLSILGLHARPSTHTMLTGSTESVITSEKNDLNTQEEVEHAINRVMSMSGDDMASVVSINSTYSRNGQRGSFGSINSLAARGNGGKQAASLLAEEQLKKLSPIGRYTAEKSYDMKRLFSSRNPAAPFSRVPFKLAEGSEVQSLAEEMDFAKGADNSPMKSTPLFNPARAQAPRVGLLGGPADSNRFTRRQASIMSSGAASLTSRRLSASSENLSAAGESKAKSTMFRVQSDRVADINSLAQNPATYGNNKNNKFGEDGGWSPRRAGMQRFASQSNGVQNNVGIGWEEYDNTAIVSDSLTYSGLHSNSVQEENTNPIQYHRHVRHDTPTKRDLPNSDNSPMRPSNDSRHSADAELPLPTALRTRKPDSVSFEPAIATGAPRSPRPSVNFERPVSVNDVERMEGYGGFGDEMDEEEDDELEFTPLDDIQEAIKVAPLKTLGSNVHEFISRQQLHTVLDMWRLLRTGVEVLKHGRRGSPKFKTLLCDVHLTKLYWRSAGSKADPDQDDLPEDLRYYPTLLDSSASSAELAHGISPIEFMPTSNTSRMGRTPFGAKSNADRVLYIRDILAVRDDCNTEVMQRSLHKKYVTLNRTSVISIILSDRTLDFEIEEEPWNALFRALQILVNFYQVIVPGPRMTISGRPSGFSNFLTYDTTGPSVPNEESSLRDIYSSNSGPSSLKKNNSGSGALGFFRSSRSDQQEGAPLL